MERLEEYDAAVDISVAIAFQELDRRYPSAKFILTIRTVEEWLSSSKNHDKKVCTSTSRKLTDWVLELRVETFGRREFDPTT